MLHNSQLLAVSPQVKYLLSNLSQKTLNLPVISLQLTIADINGNLKTEHLNMTLTEFQAFKEEIKRMTEVLK